MTAICMTAALAGLGLWAAAAAGGPGEPALARTLTHTSPMSRLAWSPDGLRVATGGLLDRTVVVWDAGSGRMVRALSDEAGDVRALAWSPDGARLAVGRGFVRLTKDRVAIQIWDTQGWTLARSLPGPFEPRGARNDVTMLSWSPDGRLLAASREEGAITFHDPVGGVLVATVASLASARQAIAWSLDGSMLAVSGGQRSASVLILDAGTRRLLRQFATGEHMITALAWSPDGRFLVTGDHGGQVRVWQADSGRAARTLLGPGHSVTSVEVSADGQWATAATGEAFFQLWRWPGGEHAAALGLPEGVRRAAFSPDSRYLAAVGGRHLGIWSLPQPRRRRPLRRLRHGQAHGSAAGRDMRIPIERPR